MWRLPFFIILHLLQYLKTEKCFKKKGLHIVLVFKHFWKFWFLFFSFLKIFFAKIQRKIKDLNFPTISFFLFHKQQKNSWGFQKKTTGLTNFFLFLKDKRMEDAPQFFCFILSAFFLFYIWKWSFPSFFG